MIVFDADTGKYKRHWGAYGNKPDDTAFKYDPSSAAKQFSNPVHCADVAKDGLVYACDRVGDRIQVFKRDGTFVKEGFINRRTLSFGSAYDVGFSPDAQQRFIYVPDGVNEKVHILLRDSLQIVGGFGDGGRQPGQFYQVHSIAVDSKGNINIRGIRRRASACSASCRGECGLLRISTSRSSSRKRRVKEFSNRSSP